MDTRRRGCHGVMEAMIKSAPHLMTAVKGGMGQGLRLFEGGGYRYEGPWGLNKVRKEVKPGGDQWLGEGGGVSNLKNS